MDADTSRSGPVLDIRGLTKDYGAGRGVFDLDVRVGRGEVYGFIGANGAGKTTTMRLIMDLVRPDAGSVTVLGHDAHADSLAVKRQVGYLTGELPQYPGVRVAHILGLLAGLRGGVPPARISALADRLELDLNARYRALSHGNKQKVGLVAAFMHAPELLILDEPTLGLDPLMQREVRLLIGESVDRGATCFLSSHVLPEIEAVCTRIGLIRAGRLVREGTLEELRRLRVHRIEAVLPEPGAEGLAEVPGVSDPEVLGTTVRCSVRGPVTPLLRWLTERGAVEVDSREMSLEEVFLAEYQPEP